MKYIKQLSTLILICVSSFCYGQDSSYNNLNQLQNEVSQLRDSLRDFRNENQVLKSNIENASQFMSRTDSILNTHFWLITILFTVASIVITIILALVTRNQVARAIKTYQSKNLKIITRLIATEDWGEQIRKEDKLLVIMRMGTEKDDSFTRVMNQFHTTIKEISSIKEMNDIPKNELNQYRAIVLYNRKDLTWFDEKDETDKDSLIIKKIKFWKSSFHESDFINYINHSRLDLAFFYFGSWLTDEDIDADQRILVSVANLHSQIYGNLMNLLKLRDTIYNNRS